MRISAAANFLRPTKKGLDVLACSNRQSRCNTRAKEYRVRPPWIDWSRTQGASRQRTLMAYVLVRLGGYGVKEVAEYFPGGDPTTIQLVAEPL